MVPLFLVSAELLKPSPQLPNTFPQRAELSVSQESQRLDKASLNERDNLQGLAARHSGGRLSQLLSASRSSDCEVSDQEVYQRI